MHSGDDSQSRKNHTSIGVSHFHSFLTWFTRKENIAVCVIAIVIVVLHMLIISKPASMMYDETTYVPAAKSFLTGDGLKNPEHPPLGKLFIAIGISIFGDNAVGWRIMSVIFSIASLFIFYFICLYLSHKEQSRDDFAIPSSPELPQKRSWFKMTTFIPVLATFLFASENLSFVQGHVAMLDVFYVTFMLLGFLLYLRGNYFVCGIVMGLSILCKVTALLGILAILLHWALTRRHEIATEIRLLRNNLRDKNNLFYLGAFWDMGRLFITTIIVWIVLLPLLEYPASHQFTNPISRTFAIFRFHIDFNAIHHHDPGIINKPWTWISNHTITLYYRNPLYLASINWNIWIFIIPSMLYLTYEVIRYRQVQHSIAAFALSWFFGLYLFLIPLEFITGRMMFIFYLYPAIPAVCLAIAWCAWRLWCLMKKQRKSKIIYLCILAIYIYSAVVSFFLLSPLANHLLYR